MRFEVIFRNIQATDALRERAIRKFNKVVKHLREPVECHLILRVEKHRHCAEVNVNAAGDTLKVAEESDDMYLTLDRLMHKLEQVARRQKERQQDRWQAPSTELDGFSLAQALAQIEEEGDLGEPVETEEVLRNP
jgi:putative sigma-54 modulation protein